MLENIDPTLLVNGFKKCGLLPWNPDIVRVPTTQAKNQSVTLQNETEHADNLLKHFLGYLEKEIGE